MDEKYIRNIPAISETSQVKLSQSKVLVIGCGGLGGYIVEELARLGTGNITVADPDIFVESNMNRQILCTTDTIGRNKAEVAAERIAAIDPSITTTVYSSLTDADEILSIATGIDLVFDGLDSIADRLTLEDICEKAGVPLIHGAVCGWNLQVAITMPGSRFLHDLYQQSQDDDSPEAKTILSPVPAICASIQVAQAVRILTGEHSPLENRIMFMDLSTSEANII